MLDQIIQDVHVRGWSWCDSLLKADALHEVNKFFQEHRNKFKAASIGKGATHHYGPQVRSDQTLWIDAFKTHTSLAPMLKVIEELKLGLNREYYLGLKEFESHLALYPSGSFYKRHSDCFQEGSSRVLSFVFYLHQSWGPGDGGELVLYDDRNHITHIIEPRAGSFACFLSAKFPHEVRTSLIERKSMTGWIHNKIIY